MRTLFPFLISELGGLVGAGFKAKAAIGHAALLVYDNDAIISPLGDGVVRTGRDALWLRTMEARQRKVGHENLGKFALLQGVHSSPGDGASGYIMPFLAGQDTGVATYTSALIEIEPYLHCLPLLDFL
jgi:hypothetical protein